MGITAKVNAGAVKAKFDAWSRSSAAKDRAAQKIDEYIDGDIRVSEGGSRVLTIAWVNELASELAGMIGSTADSRIGGSGITVSASGGGAHKTGGGGISASVDISTPGGFSRGSLYPAKYGGVDNIVALFEHGYNAGGSVWGEWHGDYTWSLTSREGQNFIHAAVDEFNSKYASLGITATINAPYA